MYTKKSSKFKNFKRKRNLVLTEKERQKMWDDEGPYSEAYMTFETRILDEKISRIFIKVYLSINPLTFELIRKNKKQFKNDKRIMDILEYGELRYEELGYEAQLFRAPYDNETLEIANKILGEVEEAVIKMHKFVRDYFDINTN